MTFAPLLDRVLVRRVEPEKVTRGGIILPDTAQEKPQAGEVVAVGTGAINADGSVRPLNVKPGDRVMFGKWSGAELQVDGEPLIVMNEADILGIVT